MCYDIESCKTILRRSFHNAGFILMEHTTQSCVCVCGFWCGIIFMLLSYEKYSFALSQNTKLLAVRRIVCR